MTDCISRLPENVLPSLCAPPPSPPPPLSSVSLFFICPPPYCFWRGPSRFGTVTAARFPSLHLSPSLAPIFCIMEVLLRKTRRNSTQRYAVTHKALEKVLLGMEQMPDISFTFLFIHLYLSISPLAFVSWVDMTMNNLLLLKETT